MDLDIPPRTKAVILAGGLGTRLSEETVTKPKPMVEIGGQPILWHIMKHFSSYDVNDFIVCLGYKGYMIKEYFANYALHTSDVTFDLSDGTTRVHHRSTEPWRVTLVDTGDDTDTGGRLLRVADYVDSDFFMTYGDGVADVDLQSLYRFHTSEGRPATVTVVQPPGRFGAARIEGSAVTSFVEKPEGDGGWINGGFFVLSPSVFDDIGGDDTVWERGPMVSLAERDDLSAYKHHGFWRPMDTLRDRDALESLWDSRGAPWRSW
ncbi:glucose-1-phosphate cytidylyltransferase [Actinomycetota bacterium]